MALLKILNGQAPGTVVAIGVGNQRLGRAATNDHCLPDGSVSGSHCEISLDGAGNLLVTDLGSTNGTFVEGQRVTKALLEPGQRLRLGDLEMVFEGDAPAPAPVVLNLPPPPMAVAAGPVRVAAVAAPPAPVAAEDQCRNHPAVAAVAICKKCGVKSCASCTRQQKVGRNIVHFCGACGGQCKTIAEVKNEAVVDAGRTKTFGAAVRRSLAYPFRGNGIILLIGGSIFFGFLDWLPNFSIFGLVVQVILWGYLFAIMQRIVVSSAAGEEHPPEFPEVTDIHADIVTPFLQLLVTSLLSFGPGIALEVYGESQGSLEIENMGSFLVYAGCAYFPMALLGVAMSDSYAALNPAFVFSSIKRVLPHYAVTCVFFFVLSLILGFAQEQVAQIQIPVLPWLLFWMVFLIAMMISMRVLGMLYYVNRSRLRWGL